MTAQTASLSMPAVTDHAVEHPVPLALLRRLHPIMHRAVQPEAVVGQIDLFEETLVHPICWVFLNRVLWGHFESPAAALMAVSGAGFERLRERLERVANQPLFTDELRFRYAQVPARGRIEAVRRLRPSWHELHTARQGQPLVFDGLLRADVQAWAEHVERVAAAERVARIG